MLCAAAASARPLQVKPPPATLEARAMRFLLGAIDAERRGDLNAAGSGYSAALSLARDQPEVWFDAALFMRRIDKADEAIADFKKYLELARDARDRADVERAIADLERADPIITFGERASETNPDIDGIIVLDGKVVGPSPAT